MIDPKAIAKLTAEERQALILELQLVQAEQEEQKPKRKNLHRGRPSELTDVQTEWLVEHVGIPADLVGDERRIKLSNAKGRPQRVLSQKIDRYGDPLYTREIHRKELGDKSVYAIGWVGDDCRSAAIICECIAMTSANSTVIHIPYGDDKKAAIEKAKAMVDEVNFDTASDNAFFCVEQYFDVARNIKTISPSKLPKRVGFALALAYLRSYKEDDVTALKLWESVCQSLQNDLLPPDQNGFGYADFFETWTARFVRDLKNGGKVSKTHIRKKTEILGKALKQYMKKVATKHYPKDIIDLMTEAKDNVIKLHSDDLRDEDNFPALPLSDVKTMLESAWNQNPALYNRIILQLSTYVRVIEAGRLDKCYLLANDTLNYRQEVNGQYLTTKTMGKVKRSDLVNPKTSIITRVIMKHFGFKVDRKEVDAFFSVNNAMRKSLKTADGHERSLRTTGATMAMFGENSDVCVKTFYRDVQNRMAHKTAQMVTTVYAKNRPADSEGLTVDVYLSSQKMTLKAEDGAGYHLHMTDNAWDLWLLRDFMGRHGKDLVKPLILAEVKEKEVVEQEDMVF